MLGLADKDPNCLTLIEFLIILKKISRQHYKGENIMLTDKIILSKVIYS